MNEGSYYISRCDRALFEVFAATLRDTLKIIREANESLGGRYAPVEAYATTLAEALNVNEKCRIVIEYDPADSKVCTYREELTESVKTFSEYQGCP